MSGSELRDAVAIVTGASSGIGRATALALAIRGSVVVAASRNHEALCSLEKEIVASGGKVCIMLTDVTLKDQVRRLVQEAVRQFGRIDIAVCNAGAYLRRRVVDLKIEDYERIMAVNFYGALNLIHEVLPHMLQRRRGHIAVVSSIDGKKGLPPDGAYVASKFAINGVMDVLRQELRGTGVYATTVLPGRVDTPMIATLKVPPISAKVSSKRVARAIVRGIEKRRAEVVVPYLGPKTLVVLSTLWPRLGDWLVRVCGLEGRVYDPGGGKPS